MGGACDGDAAQIDLLGQQINRHIDVDRARGRVNANQIGATAFANHLDRLLRSRFDSYNLEGMIDAAIGTISTSRASMGALQSRFESVIGNLQIASENISAARGRIMDTDFAAETANLSRAQVLQQAGMAMLSQANAVPQNVLSLLR